MKMNAPANMEQLSTLLRLGEGPAFETRQNRISPNMKRRLCRQEQPLVAMTYVVGLQSHNEFRDGVIKLLTEAGLPILTIPDKPRCNEQKYRLTGKGCQHEMIGREARDVLIR